MSRHPTARLGSYRPHSPDSAPLARSRHSWRARASGLSGSRPALRAVSTSSLHDTGGRRGATALPCQKLAPSPHAHAAAQPLSTCTHTHLCSKVAAQCRHLFLFPASPLPPSLPSPPLSSPLLPSLPPLSLPPSSLRPTESLPPPPFTCSSPGGAAPSVRSSATR